MTQQENEYSAGVDMAQARAVLAFGCPNLEMPPTFTDGLLRIVTRGFNLSVADASCASIDVTRDGLVFELDDLRITVTPDEARRYLLLEQHQARSGEDA